MSADSIARQPEGTPAGGQFAATARTEPEVGLPAPAVSAAAKDLQDAWEVRNRLQPIIAKATTHLIAIEVLKVNPDARYLELDEETTEYGTRVAASAVLDEDGNYLGSGLEDFAENADVDPDELVETVDELISSYDDLRHAEMCDAVTDPMSRPDGKTTSYRQYRIDLLAAKALYPEGASS